MPDEQPTDASLFALLEPRLTTERLSPYLMATRGNRRTAIRLYTWNIALSGAAYEALHMVEVVLRNAMDAQLRVWNASQGDPTTDAPHTADWLIDPAALLRRLIREQDLVQATSRANRAVHRHGRPVVHADVLTQLSFGTWRYLLPGRDPGRRYLWEHALSSAFPHLASGPAGLVRAIDGIYQLRNRVAHLEPLVRPGAVGPQVRAMRTVLAAIDPGIERWFVSSQRVTSVLRARP